MKIVYSSAACSRRRFRELFPVSRTMPGQQVQKYHRLMLEGLVRNGATVIGLSGPPVTRSNQKATIIREVPMRKTESDTSTFRLLTSHS